MSSKKKQMVAMTVILVASLGLLFTFRHVQKQRDLAASQARIEMNRKQDELAKARKQTENKLLNQVGSEHNKRMDNNASRVMIDNETKAKGKKLAHALFVYDSSKEYLNRQKKVSGILAASALSNHQLFPDKKDRLQVEGQDMKGELYDTNFKNGISNNPTEEKIFMTVHIGQYYSGHLTKAPTIGYELTYNKDQGKFTSIQEVGRFHENEAADEE